MNLRKIFITVFLISIFCYPLIVFPQYAGILIIAPDEFIDELQPLKQFKDWSMRPVTLISLTDIYNNSSYNGLWDNPEKIKKCIADHNKTYGSNYVMLVGDCDKFPVRYLSRDVGDPKGFQPGDLYYADLYQSNGSFDDWDGNGNNRYAQLNGTSANNNVDNVNWWPDVAIARVPVSDLTELSIYVKKVIRYELGTTNSGWFKNALLVTGNWDQDEPTKNFIASNYLSDFNVIKHYDATVWQQYPIDPTDVTGSMDKRAAPMTSYINQGVGFLNHYGHGSIDDFAWVYDKRHLNDLTNKNKLPVVFSCGCATAEFAPNPPWQDYYCTNNIYHASHAPGPSEVVPTPNPIQPGKGTTHDCDREARPEDWLVKRDAGGIVYVGSAGTANPGYPPTLDKSFFGAYHIGKKTFGDMWIYMVEQYLNTFFDQNGNVKHSDEWHRYAGWNGLVRFTPFGDPSLIVGGAYTKNLSGNISNSIGGHLYGYYRYRVTGNLTIPQGHTLSVDSSMSILFENGKKITALDSDVNKGLIIRAMPYMSIYLLALNPNADSDKIAHCIKIEEEGELKMRNGGEIKFY